MKYSNTILHGIYAAVLFIMSTTMIIAQCDTDCHIQCIGQINLSLDATCQAEITPQMGGINVTAGDPCYSAIVYDIHNKAIPGNIVTFDHLNQNLTYKVIEHDCGNVCWGNVLVEYKAAPVIDCPPDMTIACNGLDFLDIPAASGGCAAFSVELYREEKASLDCDPLFQGSVVRTYRAEDQFGNFSTCSHKIFLERVPIDDIVFPGPATISCSDTLMRFNEDGFPFPWYYQPLTGSGTASGIPVLCGVDFHTGLYCGTTGSGTAALPLIPNGGAVIIIETGDPDHPMDVEFIPESNNGSLCNATLIYTDVEFPFGGCKRKIARTWEVFEWWCNEELSTGGLQIIEIVDDMAPEFVCPTDQTVSTTADCAADIYLPAVNPVDVCGVDVNVRIEYESGFVDGDGGAANLKTGPNLITYRVSDACGNSSSCQVTYTVGDFTAPVAICERDKVISLTTTEFTTVPAHVFNKGSYDDCAIGDMVVRRMTNGCHQGLSFGSEVTLCNTYQSAAPLSAGGTDGKELPRENLLDVPVGSLCSTNNVTPNIEFNSYLDLYNINVSDETIEFSNVVDVNNPPHPGYIRELEHGTFDRYYFKFAKPHGINSCHTYDSHVVGTVISETEILIEIGAGYHTGGNGFTVELSRFSEYVDFCCLDAQEEEVMVVFRVFDHYGNFSDCMVGVEIQDKSIPQMTCPPDMTIDCVTPYDMNNLSAVFGSPEMQSNCSLAQLPHVDIDANVSQCGVGLIQRNFSIRDANDNVLTHCKQVVTITNNNPFDPTNIEWPLDYEVFDKCDVDGLHPDFLPDLYSYPTFYQGPDQCALLGYDYEDRVYSADPVTGECAVIQRTWTVVDWCNSVGGTSVTYNNPRPQLIKINNTVAPVLDEGLDLTYETANGDCNSGDILIQRSATDDCNGALIWEYTIKTVPDGAVVQKGNTNEIAGKYPVGTYTVEWIVYDGCGNFATDVQNLSIISTKAPTPVCHNGLAASLVSMDLDGDGIIDAEMVELWASDFNASSYPACDNPIEFSFSSDVTDKNLVFDCDDLGRQVVQMWVTDMVTGSQDFCEAFIDIQDAGICPDNQRVLVEGQVMTEEQVEIVGVEIELEGTTIMEMTDVAGEYAFANMPMGGSYVVSPQLDVDYLNGVSTIDLIMIQRHILGIESLDSPYKLIAADVNNSGNINGVDLVELRKLILGIYMELPANDSWRFISDDYNFLDPVNPWAESFEEDYVINTLTNDMVIDFIGVKIGDVNNSVEMAQSDDVELSSGEVNFEFVHPAMEQGEISTIELYADSYNEIRGWQGTFEFDPAKFEVVTINGLALNVSAEKHSYTARQDEGWWTMSYDSDEAAAVKADEALVEIIVRAKSQITATDDLVQVTSSRTKAEAYNGSLDKLELTGARGKAEIAEILAINPNPWVNEAMITFNLPQAGAARFEFFDVNGRLIYYKEGSYSNGLHEMKITRGDLNVNGLIYVRMYTTDGISEYRTIIYK